ncbi:MAG: hypothetical protein OHK0032_13260 [Thermodesulfovibrionales bacterium]
MVERIDKEEEEADYYPEIPFTEDEAIEAIEMARDFLERAKAILK